MTEKDFLTNLSAAQAKVASALELDLPVAMTTIGPMGPVALVIAIREAALPVEALRYIAQTVDRLADDAERAADMRGG